MLVLRQSLKAHLRHLDAKSIGQPLRSQCPMAPLPAASLLVATEDWDPAAGELLDFHERLFRIEPIKDLGLVAFEVFGGAHAVEPGTGVEFPVEPEAFADTEPGCATADADAEVTFG